MFLGQMLGQHISRIIFLITSLDMALVNLLIEIDVMLFGMISQSFQCTTSELTHENITFERIFSFVDVFVELKIAFLHSAIITLIAAERSFFDVFVANVLGKRCGLD
jgi:hypothetical protein